MNLYLAVFLAVSGTCRPNKVCYPFGGEETCFNDVPTCRSEPTIKWTTDRQKAEAWLEQTSEVYQAHLGLAGEYGYRFGQWGVSKLVRESTTTYHISEQSVEVEGGK